MSNNINITPGSGAVVATDDVSGVEYQKIKIDQGGAGVSALPPASGVADTGNPIKIGGKYNASAPTFSDGQRADKQVDVNGNDKVTQATLLAGEDLSVTGGVMRVEHHYTYKQITGSTQILAAAGFVHAVSISPLTATPTAGLLTVYDNTAGSGTIVYEGWVFATDPARTIILDVVVATGCYVLYTTVANVSVTVSYRTQP